MRFPFLSLLLICACACAWGQSAGGFPKWEERVLLEWTNRARSDPQYEMKQCGANCPEAACYQPTSPVLYQNAMNRSARFHGAEMAQQGYFAHNSACTLVSNINSLYPGSCNGSASCACVGGTRSCSSSGCTSWSGRIQLFGGTPRGEIIATGTDPNRSFYLWLFEPYNKTSCGFGTGSPTNGHRYLILESGPLVGYGVQASSSGGTSTGDFGGYAVAIPKIPSGAHYPQQASTVSMWVNWYDRAAPSQSTVVVDGIAHAMWRARGTNLNGAWTAQISGVGTGCHRYYFAFKDYLGTAVRYPSTGTYGIGTGATCPDWAP